MSRRVAIRCSECGDTKPSRYRGVCERCYQRLRYRRLAAEHGGTPPAWLEAVHRYRKRQERTDDDT